MSKWANTQIQHINRIHKTRPAYVWLAVKRVNKMRAQVYFNSSCLLFLLNTKAKRPNSSNSKRFFVPGVSEPPGWPYILQGTAESERERKRNGSRDQHRERESSVLCAIVQSRKLSVNENAHRTLQHPADCVAMNSVGSKRKKEGCKKNSYTSHTHTHTFTNLCIFNAPLNSLYGRQTECRQLFCLVSVTHQHHSSFTCISGCQYLFCYLRLFGERLLLTGEPANNCHFVFACNDTKLLLQIHDCCYTQYT